MIHSDYVLRATSRSAQRHPIVACVWFLTPIVRIMAYVGFTTTLRDPTEPAGGLLSIRHQSSGRLRHLVRPKVNRQAVRAILTTTSLGVTSVPVSRHSRFHRKIQGTSLTRLRFQQLYNCLRDPADSHKILT